MGVNRPRDYRRRGLPDIFRTNFSDERETLYRNRGDGEFDDVTVPPGSSRNTRFVGWGCGFFDFDNDGWQDLLLVNGHVFPEVERSKHRHSLQGSRDSVSQHRRRQVSGHLRKAPAPAYWSGTPRAARLSATSITTASVEVLVNNQNEAPSLLHLSQRPAGHWLIIRLVGTRSNRSAIGARVRHRRRPTQTAKSAAEAVTCRKAICGSISASVVQRVPIRSKYSGLADKYNGKKSY